MANQNEYVSLRTHQVDISNRLQKIEEDLELMTLRGKLSVHESLSEEVENRMTDFQKNHKRLKALAVEDEAFLDKSYFKDNVKGTTDTVYDSLLDQFHELEEKAKTLKRSFNSNVTESSVNEQSFQAMMEEAVEVALKKRIAETANDSIGATTAGGFNNATLEKLFETINNGHNRNELKFPNFPSDHSLFFEWQQRVENYFETDGRNLRPVVRLQKVKEACEKSDEARMITRKYLMHDKNYQLCMNELSRRFMITRNVAANEVERVIQLKSHPPQKLQVIYDSFTSFRANTKNMAMRAAIQETLPPGKSIEHLSLEKEIEFLYGALLLRTLDPATKTQLASKLDLAVDQPLPVARSLVIIEHRFTSMVHATGSNQSQARPPAKVSFAQRENDGKRYPRQNSQQKQVGRRNGNSGQPKSLCFICNDATHLTDSCPQFVNANGVKEKWRLIMKHKICANCLNGKFRACSCSRSNCNHCNEMHDSSLHPMDGMKKERKANVRCSQSQSLPPSQESREYAAIEDSSRDEVTRSTLTVDVFPQNRTAKIAMAQRQPMRPTAMIQVVGLRRTKTCRALFDTGATDTLISRQLAEDVGMILHPTYVPITTFENKPGETITSFVDLIVKPHHEIDVSDVAEYKCQALVTANVGGLIPYSQAVRCPAVEEHEVQLADPTYDQPGPIEVIFGTREVAELWTADSFTVDGAVLQGTRLGHVLIGSAEVAAAMVMKREYEDRQVKLTDLERFFMHELTDEEHEDVYVEDFYKKTVRRLPIGFMVRIPWKLDFELGQSRRITEARTRNMLRRLSPKARQQYGEHVNALKRDGYMVTPPIDRPAKNFIANFALEKDSPTTPIRLLFTCDQSTTNGLSINDVQHCGPRLQRELAHCIMRFRRFEVAVSGDVSKMFLRIQLHPDDAAYQHTLIGTDPDGPLEEVQLPTVIFGMKSSPYLALRTMLEIAAEVEKKFPIAAKLLRESFYVDDLTESFETVQLAEAAIKELNMALETSNFEMSKWSSSHSSVLREIPTEKKMSERSIDFDEVRDADDVRILGMQWDRQRDMLGYKADLPPPVERPTLRDAASLVAKLFDPLGLLAPTTVVGRQILQRVWMAARESGTIPSAASPKKAVREFWNGFVPAPLATEFKEWQKDLAILKTLNIPRWLQHATGNEEMLIGFADASTISHGCAIYYRTVSPSGEVHVTLIGGKAKINKMEKVGKNKSKPLSIPRLELEAAKLLASHIEFARVGLGLPNDFPVRAYSDSMITLAWIQGDAHRFATFVANRVRDIKKFVSPEKWFYVDTKENPADLASRGIRASELINSKLWFSGPDFLREPKFEEICEKFDTNEEVKKQCQIATLVAEDDWIIQSTERIATWPRTVRSFAQVLRARDRFLEIRARRKDSLARNAKRGPLLASECKQAQLSLIKRYQQMEYPEAYRSLEDQKPALDGRLRSLLPFMDSHGLLRVGGRLENSFIPYDEKHPIILPRMESSKKPVNADRRSLTHKVLEWVHERTLHGGEFKALAYLRSMFHVPNARNALRSVIHRCVRCSILRAERYKQLMGNVPKELTMPAPPFFMVTVDYAGPVYVKHQSRRRSARVNAESGERELAVKDKGWISIYVCMATGAYHIELVNSLTAEACVAAFQRFFAARGISRLVRSDNGTNYVKANKIFVANEKRSLKRVNVDSDESRKKATDRDQLALEIGVQAIIDGHREVQERYSMYGLDMDVTMEWAFNPPLAPNFGGKHEAAVKQIKAHLKRVIGLSKLPYDELLTVLKQIEAALNSRPLCRIQGDASDRQQILTPAHFLIGRQLNLPVEPMYDEVENLHDRYRKRQSMFQRFWRLWSQQVLTHMQQRPQWTKVEGNIKINELVLMVDDNQPPLAWRRAIVTEVKPGKDGLVRVVKLKDSKQNEFERSVRKLARLPLVAGEPPTPIMINDDDESGERIPEVDNEPPLAQSEDSTQTPKKLDTEPVPPSPVLRRSKRIASKEKKGMMGSMLYFSLILCVFGAPVQALEGTTVGVTSVKEAGLLYMHDGDVMIKTGVHHVKFVTNLQPTNDSQRVNDYLESFKKTCERASREFQGSHCTGQTHALEHDAKALNKKIGRLMTTDNNIKSRSKREGIFWKLWDWFFASNDIDNAAGLSKSMGVMHHALEAFQNVELQTNQQAQNVESALDRVVDEMNEQASKFWTAQSVTGVQVKMIFAKEVIQDVFNQLSVAYSELNKLPPWSDNEFQEMIDGVNKRAKPAIVPNIPREQLERILEITVHVENGTMNTVVGIPIVREERFHRFYVTPMPHANTNVISDGQPQFLTINQKLQQWTVETPLAPINETLSITDDVVSIFHRVTPQSPCAVTTIMEVRGNCTLIQLPARYDVWHQTPVHNVLVFYSNIPKELICARTRSTIQETAGTLKLDPECYVETADHVIRPSQDRTSVQKNVFKFDVEILDTDLSQQKLKVVTLPSDLTKPLDMTKVDEVKAEIVANIEMLPWWTWVTGGTATLAVIAVVVGLLIYRQWSQPSTIVEINKEAERAHSAAVMASPPPSNSAAAMARREPAIYATVQPNGKKSSPPRTSVWYQESDEKVTIESTIPWHARQR